MNQQNYDVIIVGAGPMGIFTAYELTTLFNDKKILLIDRGHDIYTRKCPVLEHKIKHCPKDKDGNSGCKPACSMTNGFGGSGAYSDGKFNITAEFGGWMTDYLPEEEVLELIRYVDNINLKHGAPNELTKPYTHEVYEIEKKAISVGLKLLRSEVRHLGTEINLQVLKNIYEELKKKMDFLFETNVIDVIVENNEAKGVVLENGDKLFAKAVVLGVGRAGSEWLSQVVKKHGVEVSNNRVDIGVRVEIPAKVFEHITDAVYESKLVYRTKCHGDKIRTFCMNPYGHVVTENVDGLMTVNGHSYSDPALRSENTNFALLVSSRFTKPFNDPYQYGKRIASLSNLLGGGILVQRFGDLIKGNRTNEHRLSQSFVNPTLNATPGDLSLVIPKRQLDDIIEMIYALDKIAPGMANHDTLLYGVEVKFYSAKPELTNELETKYKNMFAIGDGAGVTRGLAQAAATGIHVARCILKRI